MKASELIQKIAEQISQNGDHDLDFEAKDSDGNPIPLEFKDIDFGWSDHVYSGGSPFATLPSMTVHFTIE